MTSTPTAKPRLVTRRIGGLSALQAENVEMVIWSRQLPPPVSTELLELAASELEPVDFITLTTDPTDRIRQQLGLAGVHSPFLVSDIAQLVTALGELSKARRIRVYLSTTKDEAASQTTPKRAGLQVACVYSEEGIRPLLTRKSNSRSKKKREHLAARVVAFRPGILSAKEAPAEGLYLRLIAVTEK